MTKLHPSARRVRAQAWGSLLLSFDAAVAASLSPGENACAQAVNEAGQVLARVLPADVNAPARYRVYSPR